MTSTTTTGRVVQQADAPSEEGMRLPEPLGDGELTAEEELVAVVSEKGGVGKTALFNGMAAASAVRQEAFLGCDLDPRATGTSELGLDRSVARLTVADILASTDREGRFIPPFGLAIEAVVPAGEAWGKYVYALPSERALSHREMDATGGMELRLREALKGGLLRRFRRGAIDVAPRAGGRLVQVALAAATHVLISATLDEDGRDGAEQALESIKVARESGLNPDLKVIGILPNMVQLKETGKSKELLPDTRLGRMILDYLQDTYGDLVLPVFIPAGVARKESRFACEPISSHGTPTADAMLKAYGAVLDEIHQRRNGMDVRG